MGKADYYLNGSYNAICDVCGFKFKAKDLRMTWDGFFVCKEDWEPRNQQDFVKGVKDDQSVPIARPEQTQVFVGDVGVDDL